MNKTLINQQDDVESNTYFHTTFIKPRLENPQLLQEITDITNPKS